MKLVTWSLALVVGSLAGCALVTSVSPSFASDAPADTLAKDILAKAGVRAEVGELPRVGDGSLAVALARQGVAQVHGLASEAAAAESARKPAARSGGAYFSGEGNWVKFGTKGVFGFDVAVDEGDDKDISQQVWRRDANDAEDSSHFGTIVLTAQPAPESPPGAKQPNLGGTRRPRGDRRKA
jgi:hypothetical protein